VIISWQAVSERYRPYLQLNFTINLLIFVVPIVVAQFIPKLQLLLPPWYWLATGGLVLWLFLLLYIAPRRYQYTAFAATEVAIMLRRGALWRSQRGVPLNRIQHVEIKEGWLERQFGICQLCIYTAGSGGADIRIPGLPPNVAEPLKLQLLRTIAAEQLLEQSDD
jgi:membrane protein YdbS with pleckstrin-like domain